jgi:hypothetical protein
VYSPTYAELKSYLQKELDLEDETFITDDEFLSYFNEAVDMVEAAIHNIYEDYFLTMAALPITAGTAAYSLPSDIYAQKIRKILYNDNGSLKYEIRRIKRLEDTLYIEQADLYAYILMNSGSTGMKVNFFPTPQDSNSNISVWYLRNAKRFTTDTDVCDIPEFTSVVVQFVRYKCLTKEGHPDAASAAQDLERMKQEMVDTLTARVPDEDNTVLKDTTFYRDFDDWRFGGGFY